MTKVNGFLSQALGKIWDDDTNIIAIEYSYKYPEYGGPYLEWLTNEEADLVDNFRASNNESTT